MDLEKFIPIKPDPSPKRSCGECTACCEGWLNGIVYGQPFYRGKPCYFLQKTCSIYPERPYSPCKEFNCVWLASDELPMWMRPDLSKVIVTKNEFNGIQYYNVIETDTPMKSSVLNHIIQWAMKGNVNIQYYIEGGPNRIGSQEFLEMKEEEGNVVVV